MAGARGAGREDLGSQPTQFDVGGGFYDADALTSLQQLDRWKMAGNSLKLLNPYRNTVVYIDAVAPVMYLPSNLKYSLKLIESKFKQLASCDALTGWSDGEGGAVALEDTTPQPTEGYYCVTDDVAADDKMSPMFTPASLTDLTYYKYLCFDVRVNNIANLDTLNVEVIDNDGDSALFDFKSQVTETNKWFRVITHKTEFTETGTMDWSILESVAVNLEFDSNGAYQVALDDVGAYE
jgi:hypothetical protein